MPPRSKDGESSTFNLGVQPPALRLDPRTGQLLRRDYVLTVSSGPDAGKRAPLQGTLVVGTHAQAGFSLTDRAISRYHVELEARADGVRVRDLGSTNGTFIGKVRVGEVVLEARERVEVELGQTRLEIVSAEKDVALSGKRASFGGAFGTSAAMRRVFGILEKVAPTQSQVVLWGETGTGKDVLARAIHQASPRLSGPFVALDCASLSPELVESELFGHVRGAFSGATADRDGAFLRAHLGTLFLDELGELPLEQQPKLLRALENGVVRRVGEDLERRVDVRVVAATHRDLEADAAAGRFRQDLFFRLAVVLVKIPPLRERLEDLPLLAEHLLEELGASSREISPLLLQRMRAHAWPGNVRELKNVLQRLHVSGMLELGAGVESAGPASLEGLSFKDAKDQVFEAFVREYLGALARACKGNLSEISRRAKINRNHVRRLLTRYGIDFRAS